MDATILDFDLVSIQDMRDAVKKAKEAQIKYHLFSQAQVDAIVKKVADAAFEHAAYLGKLAADETGMGIAEHKKIKNEVGSRDVYESIRDLKTVGIIAEDRVKKVVEIAEPFGVVAGIIPTTNPTSTAIFKVLIALKTRNAIVISPHPNAAHSTIKALEVCYEDAVSAGAPEGIIGWISTPTMAATEGLMTHRDVDLILATGGSGLVRAAYSSGKPAYGVGPGNVPVYLEKTADVRVAVKRIVDSKTFDNGTICATEQALIVDAGIKEKVIQEFKNLGAYFLNEKEKPLVEKVISLVPGKLNPQIVGKHAMNIAEMAGVKVPSHTCLLIAEETRVGRDIPFSIEKLSPIFPFYTVRNEEEALNLCEQLLDLGGRGHTLSLHTKNDQLAKKFALKLPVSRILVNTPSAIGAVGGTTGLMPSLTLGCGSFGGNITSDNISAHHLLNIKRLAYGTKEVEIPSPSITNKEEYKIEAIVEEVIQNISSKKQVDANVIADMVNQVLARYQ